MVIAHDAKRSGIKYFRGKSIEASPLFILRDPLAKPAQNRRRELNRTVVSIDGHSTQE